jgi:hypothetical protein
LSKFSGSKSKAAAKTVKTKYQFQVWPLGSLAVLTRLRH